MTNCLPFLCTTLHKFCSVQQALLEKVQRFFQQQYLTDCSVSALNIGLTGDAATSSRSVGGAAW
jgi:hypothetical protein